MAALNESFQQVQNEVQPKKKFGFKVSKLFLTFVVDVEIPPKIHQFINSFSFAVSHKSVLKVFIIDKSGICVQLCVEHATRLQIIPHIAVRT